MITWIQSETRFSQDPVILDTFDRLEVLESISDAVINARAVGEVSVMPEPALRELRAAFQLE